MNDLKDILSDGEDNLANDDLINYIKDNLSEEERHELEKKTVNSTFVNDAMEGLQSFNNKQQLNLYVQQLNKNLQQQLAGKKQRKQKHAIQQNIWVIITILALLAICILGYLFIHFHRVAS